MKALETDVHNDLARMDQSLKAIDLASQELEKRLLLQQRYAQLIFEAHYASNRQPMRSFDYQQVTAAAEALIELQFNGKSQEYARELLEWVKKKQTPRG